MSSSESDCEGESYDSYELAALLPIMGSVWRLLWPIGLAGLFQSPRRRWR